MAAHSAGALVDTGPPERTPEGFRGSFQATSQCRRPTPFSVRPGASLISGQTKSTGKAGRSSSRSNPRRAWRHRRMPAAAQMSLEAACQIQPRPPNTSCCCAHPSTYPPPPRHTHTLHPRLCQHPRTPRHTQVTRQVGKHSHEHTH